MLMLAYRRLSCWVTIVSPGVETGNEGSALKQVPWTWSAKIAAMTHDGETISRVQIRPPALSEKERKRKVCCSTRIHSVEYHALSGDSLSNSAMFYVWSVSSMDIFGGVLCQSVRLGILRELVLTLRHFYTLYWDLMADICELFIHSVECRTLF